MRQYGSFFRIRFINGLQYRAAALAGVSTQFAWGFLLILLFQAFYKADPAAFPMTMPQLAAYIWMQQAFLALFMPWVTEKDIVETIINGNIAYELVRPTDLYTMWLAKGSASRLASTVLRCMPILLVAVFLPEPFRLTAPPTWQAALLFGLTTAMGFGVVVCFTMLMYVTAFYTLSWTGVRTLAISTSELLSGSLIPLPFFPDGVRQVVEALPFAAMQNIPLRVYSGQLAGPELGRAVALQAFWLIALFLIGKLLTQRALRRVIVQGG